VVRPRRRALRVEAPEVYGIEDAIPTYSYTEARNMTHIDKALAQLRAVHDPYERLHEADRLDGALAVARTWVAQIKRDTINELRNGNTGYGRIGLRLGLTKGRIQQIANTASKLGSVVYAVRDEHGNWHGNDGLLPKDSYTDAPLAYPFREGDESHRLAGQRLTARYGNVTEDESITAYSLRVKAGEGREISMRMTEDVLRALFP
jgi:hypothetical protein